VDIEIISCDKGVAAAGRVAVAGADLEVQTRAVAQDELGLSVGHLNPFAGLQADAQGGFVDEGLAPIAREGEIAVRVVRLAEAGTSGHPEISALLVLAGIEVDRVDIGAVAIGLR